MIRGAAPVWLGLSQTSHLEDFKAAGACLSGLLAIHGQYMSEFMKTVSSLKQNFFACLPAMARHKKGGSVGCVLTDCLWMIELNDLCNFL